MPSHLITVSAYSLQDKEHYNFVLKRSTFTFYNKSVVTCYHVILFSTWYMFVFPTMHLKLLLFHRLQGLNLFMAFKRVPRCSLQDKEHYNFVLKRSTFTFYNKSVVTCYPCHLIQYLVHVCISHYVFKIVVVS